MKLVLCSEGFHTANTVQACVELCGKPHLNSPLWPNNRADKLAAVCDDTNFPVYALQDDSALVIDGDQQKCIGTAPVKIMNGEIVAP